MYYPTYQAPEFQNYEALQDFTPNIGLGTKLNEDAAGNFVFGVTFRETVRHPIIGS